MKTKEQFILEKRNEFNEIYGKLYDKWPENYRIQITKDIINSRGRK